MAVAKNNGPASAVHGPGKPSRTAFFPQEIFLGETARKWGHQPETDPHVQIASVH